MRFLAANESTSPHSRAFRVSGHVPGHCVSFGGTAGDLTDAELDFQKCVFWLDGSGTKIAPAAPTAAESAALPGVQASDFEFIEMLNNGTTSLNLGGAQFDRGITFVFPGGFTLAPGARTVIASNQAAFALRYGNSIMVTGQYEGNLDNSGERVRLIDNVGEVILDFIYSGKWYAPAKSGGYSLISCSANPAYDSYGAATTWAISGQTGGSPGNMDTSFSQTFEGWRHDYFTAAQRS